MSLDEWKTMQEQSRPKTEFNIRKADTKLPSKAVVIHKSKHIEASCIIFLIGHHNDVSKLAILASVCNML